MKTYLEPNWGYRSHIADADGLPMCRGHLIRVKTCRRSSQPQNPICAMCLIEDARKARGEARPAPRVKTPAKLVACLYCKADLLVEGYGWNKKFCNASCRNRYNRIRYPHLYETKPADPVEKYCDECGAHFTEERNSHRRFCCEKCQKRNGDRRRYEERKRRMVRELLALAS